VGTRFLLAEESPAHESYKGRLVAAVAAERRVTRAEAVDLITALVEAAVAPQPGAEPE